VSRSLRVELKDHVCPQIAEKNWDHPGRCPDASLNLLDYCRRDFESLSC